MCLVFNRHSNICVMFGITERRKIEALAHCLIGCFSRGSRSSSFALLYVQFSFA